MKRTLFAVAVAVTASGCKKKPSAFDIANAAEFVVCSDRGEPPMFNFPAGIPPRAAPRSIGVDCYVYTHDKDFIPVEGAYFPHGIGFPPPPLGKGLRALLPAEAPPKPAQARDDQTPVVPMMPPTVDTD